MSTVEWMTAIGQAAEDLGYGISKLEPHRVELIARQERTSIVIESLWLSGDYLRRILVPIPHRSGTSYTRAFTERAK